MIEKRWKKCNGPQSTTPYNHTGPKDLRRQQESFLPCSGGFWDEFWNNSLSNHVRLDTSDAEHQQHIQQISLNRRHTNHSTWVMGRCTFQTVEGANQRLAFAQCCCLHKWCGWIKINWQFGINAIYEFSNRRTTPSKWTYLSKSYKHYSRENMTILKSFANGKTFKQVINWIFCEHKLV